MSLYRIKPLEWREWMNGESAKSSFGWYTIRQAGAARRRSPWLWSFAAGEQVPCDSLEAGKAACEAHWRAKLAEVLEEVPEDWQPIETAPKDRSRVRVGWPGVVGGDGRYDSHTGKWFDSATGKIYAPDQPTHWMPLPKPAGGPKEGK